MLVRLVKTQEIGMEWTSGHRDRWTECNIVFEGKLPIAIRRNGSCNVPNPTAQDIQKSLWANIRHAEVKQIFGYNVIPDVTPLMIEKTMEIANEIVEFFNSIEEGEKIITLPFAQLATA